MAWIQVTWRNNNRTVYINTDNVFRIDDWEGNARLRIIATSSDTDERHSPDSIILVESVAEVLKLMEQAGEKVVRRTSA
ncbi:hypothetical protein [Methylobacterium sp. 1973]|uniref:hypothetical protein n=1 Tax=Methylobacterium sp. 1973 TaxID=3156421 RepID=UPI003399444C